MADLEPWSFSSIWPFKIVGSPIEGYYATGQRACCFLSGSTLVHHCGAESPHNESVPMWRLLTYGRIRFHICLHRIYSDGYKSEIVVRIDGCLLGCSLLSFPKVSGFRHYLGCQTESPASLSTGSMTESRWFNLPNFSFSTLWVRYE